MQAPPRLCPSRELSEERQHPHLRTNRSTSYDDPMRGNKENLPSQPAKRQLGSQRPMMPLCPTTVSPRVYNSYSLSRFYQRMEVLESTVERGTTSACPKGFEAVF